MNTSRTSTCTMADLQAALLGAGASPEAVAHAQALQHVAPRIWGLTWSGREWIGALVRHLRPWGVEQVVDLGCGMPTRVGARGPVPVETHEHAFAAGMRRCAYVDVEPEVIRARCGLPSYRGGAALADITVADQLHHALAECGIDPDRPTLVLLGWVLGWMDDAQVTHTLGLIGGLFTHPLSLVAVSHLSGWGPAPGRFIHATGQHVYARSAQDLLALLGQAGLHPHQGPTPVEHWPLPHEPTPGTDVLCALARIGGRR